LATAKRDYYDVLGLTRGASETDIKRAFRAQARKYHPDVNKASDAETRFKEINEAYEVLGDPRKRAAYDRYGHAGQGAGFDAFSDLGGFADIFETFFGAGTRRGGYRGPQRGADLRYDLSLTFEEAVFGIEKEIELPTLQFCHRCDGSGAEPGSGSTTCPRCHGSGELRRVQQSVFGQFVNVVMCDTCQGEGQIVSSPCTQCHGQGRERGTKKLAVKIPAGVDNGQQIRLAGEGELGGKNGPPGDLYIVLEIAEHPLFKRDGYDIYYDLPLTVTQAALGTDVTVPTLDGDTQLRVPAGTQHGRSFPLRSRGVPHLRASGRGTMYVVTRVVVPTKLTARQRELFEELGHELGEQPESDKGFFDRVKEAFGG
jgi:molecular chaperone DnaJ